MPRPVRHRAICHNAASTGAGRRVDRAGEPGIDGGATCRSIAAGSELRPGFESGADHQSGVEMHERSQSL